MYNSRRLCICQVLPSFLASSKALTTGLLTQYLQLLLLLGLISLASKYITRVDKLALSENGPAIVLKSARYIGVGPTDQKEPRREAKQSLFPEIYSKLL